MISVLSMFVCSAYLDPCEVLFKSEFLCLRGILLSLGDSCKQKICVSRSRVHLIENATLSLDV